MDVSKLVSLLGYSPRVFLAIAIASAIVLFSPERFLALLGLEAVTATYRPWIGGTFILSGSLYVVSVGSWLLGILGPALRERWNARQWAKGLHELSPAEQEILAEYLDHDTTTRTFHVSDGVVGGLVAKHILFRSSNFGRPWSMHFDHNIQPWAWRYLRKHPHLVGRSGWTPLEATGREGDV